MELLLPKVEIIDWPDEPLRKIERAARTCYKSEYRISENSSEKLVSMLINKGHLAMLEFVDATVRVVCDRGVTHEIVRHRLFSYAQESTRFCDYGSGHIKYIIPVWLRNKIEPGETKISWHSEYGEVIESPKDAWLYAMQYAENMYKGLREEGWPPQKARSVLPNSLKTEIVMKANFREWMHFFKLRNSMKAHPDMRYIASMIETKFIMKCLAVFAR